MCSFTARQGTGDRGVRVAVDEHPVGRVLLEDGVEGGQHGTGLDAAAAGADLEVDVRLRDVQVVEEDVAHPHAVVLAGVHDDVAARADSRACTMGAT